MSSLMLGDWYFLTIVAMLTYGLYHFASDRYVSGFINKHDSDDLRPLAINVILAGNSITVALISFMLLTFDFNLHPEIVAYGIEHGSCLNPGEWPKINWRFIGDAFARFLYGRDGIVYVNPTEQSKVAIGIFVAFLQGFLFFRAHQFRFNARKVFKQAVVLPVIKSSNLIVILVSWWLLNEEITQVSLAGFLIIGISIYMLRDFDREKDDKSKKSSDLEWVMAALQLTLAMAISAATALLSKFVVSSLQIDIWLFICISNLISIFFATLLIQRELKKLSQSSLLEIVGNHGYKLLHRGIKVGLLNFIAFASLLQALVHGNASIVLPIYSLYTIVPILLSVIILNQKLTEKTTVGVILSIIAITILS